jgi:hypothetical protein
VQQRLAALFTEKTHLCNKVDFAVLRRSTKTSDQVGLSGRHGATHSGSIFVAAETGRAEAKNQNGKGQQQN